MNEFSLRVKDAVTLSFMLTASLQIGLLLALKTCLAPYDLCVCGYDTDATPLFIKDSTSVRLQRVSVERYRC